jgi:hypothetical protein
VDDKAAGAAEDDEVAVDASAGSSLADSAVVEGEVAGTAEDDEAAVDAGVAGMHEDNKAGETEGLGTVGAWDNIDCICILDAAGVFSGSDSLSFVSETCALDFFCFFF